MERRNFYAGIAIVAFSGIMAANPAAVSEVVKNADDILTEVSAKDSLFLLDTYIMEDGLRHFTWSGKFVSVAFGSDNDIYFKDICAGYKFNTYVKGTIDGDTIRIPVGQHVFHQDADPDHGIEEADLYLAAANINEDSTEVVVNAADKYIRFVKEKDGTIRSMENCGAAYVDDSGVARATNYTYRYEPFNIQAETVKLPENADSVKYALTFKNEPDGKDVVAEAYVIDAGDKVFVKGLTRNVQGWVEGTVEGDSVYFKSYQYVGRYNNGELENDFAVFFNGAHATDDFDLWGRVYRTTDRIGFYYDKNNGLLSSKECVTESVGTQNPYGHIVEPMLQKIDNTGGENVRPANPTIENYQNYVFQSIVSVNVPAHDSEGRPLDKEKLSYRFYLDDAEAPFAFTTSDYHYIEQDLVEIPYTYLDYDGLGSDISKGDSEDSRKIVFYTSFKKLAIQMLYTDNGKTVVSDKYVYDVDKKTGEVVGGIVLPNPELSVKSVVCADMSGRVVENPRQGIFIEVKTFSDGSQKITKIRR